ncbi:aldo/keto reductase [Luteimicrobium subarcticum]|uniref:aldo/keto reductase n=1 Tax=Luteimicrobium subarcticum TaxID=620910 RepID=UPI000C24C1A5|nr:aldo/keto reductase [Luteimicrobium subarcticum]
MSSRRPVWPGTFFPIGGAFPGLPKVTDEPVVHDVAQRVGASPSQVALAWLLHHDPRTLLIPGTASLDHLEANTAVGDVHLDDAALAALDAVPSRSTGTPA